MTTVLIIIVIIAAVFLVACVLVQKSKGGGLAAGFQGSNQIMGAPKTADFLEKATWVLMGVIAVCCIASTLFLQSGNVAADTDLQVVETVDEAPGMYESVTDSIQG